MALRSVLTTAGINAVWPSDGSIRDASVTIKYIKVGSALLSADDVVPTIEEDDLGTIVFGGAPDVQELSMPSRVGRQITFHIDLGVDVGDFDIGNVGLYLNNGGAGSGGSGTGGAGGPGTLFAVGALDTVVDKIRSQGTAVGNHWRANMPVLIRDDVGKILERDDISVVASTRTISTVAGSFSSVFDSDDTVVLSGFTNSGNNDRYKIESIAADGLSMVLEDPDSSLVNESAGASFTIEAVVLTFDIALPETSNLPEADNVDLLETASRAVNGANAVVVTNISSLATAKSASPSSYPQWAISGYHVMGILDLAAVDGPTGRWLEVTKTDWEGILPFDPSDIPVYSADAVGLPAILVQTNADAGGSLTLPIGRVKAVGSIVESSDTDTNWRLTFENTARGGVLSQLEAGDSVAIMLSADYLIRDAIGLIAGASGALTEIPDDYLTQGDIDTAINAAINAAINDLINETLGDDEAFAATVNAALDARPTQSQGDARYLRGSAGTRMVFYMASAPTGWTKVANINDRLLRVVSGNGGGTGGNWEISGLTIAGTTLSIDQIPAHTHSSGSLEASDAGGHTHEYVGPGNNNWAVPGSVNSRPLTTHARTRDTDAAGSHSHDVAGNTGSSGGGASHSHAINAGSGWRPAYANVIICERN